MTISDFLEKNRGRKTFLEHEVKGFLNELGMPVPNGIFIGKNGAVTSPHGLAFPLAAKVSSSSIVSKSEVRGVRLGIKDSAELERAVADLSGIPGAEGVLVEEMAPQGLEVIAGGIIDSQFGPLVMFGTGGVLVELFKDAAFALAPMKKDDALWLIRQVKGYKLIEGYRGNPPVNIESLTRILIAVSELIGSGLLEEIDLNPVVLYPQGAIVLDAKMKPA